MSAFEPQPLTESKVDMPDFMVVLRGFDRRQVEMWAAEVASQIEQERRHRAEPHERGAVGERLGDLVYVESPSVGKKFDKGQECGVVESVKAASDIYAPIGGEGWRMTGIDPEGLDLRPHPFFDRAVIEDSTGLSTGLLNNYGDLPFHISVITSFAYGNNFPPEDPTYAGVRFTYPFASDFISAMFLRCGADLRQSMFIENFLLAISFIGLVHRWALEMLRHKLAAVITPLIVILSGGLGWVLLFEQAGANDGGLFGLFGGQAGVFALVSLGVIAIAVAVLGAAGKTHPFPAPRRRCSSRRGMISTKLQGRWR